MFSIAAINDTDSGGQWEPLAPSKEAQEFHLSQTYHDGLLKLQAKDFVKARELLETVLKDPLISSAQMDGNASNGHLLSLRFLALKNLATVFLQQGSIHNDSALRCYLQAVEIDAKDSVVWNQLGTLSCSMGLLSTSRWAFEQGLLCSPNNWNCMEKLLEILIAIGDEVACLSVADLILRHWPSHSRALHVKNTIEDAEPIPFAPRGIDKLEPKHVRLKFPNKRKATDDRMEDISVKRHNQNIELYLAGATWAALADGILRILFSKSKKASEQVIGCDQDNMVDGKVDSRHESVVKGTCGGTAQTGTYERNDWYLDAKIIIHLSASSELVRDSAEGKEVSATMGCERVSLIDSGSCMVNEKDSCTEEEHPQERRSTRLERLRSRKPGKEELDLSSGKDPGKVVFQFLEPFVLSRPRTIDCDFAGDRDVPCPDILAYSSVHEHNDVEQFIVRASKNWGAYHIGHLLLEEIAHKNLPYNDSFVKLLDLEKLTRQWGWDRSPLCSLFLAELYYDQGSDAANEHKCSEFHLEASYHLCKVIELVAVEYYSDLAVAGSNDNFGTTSEKDDLNKSIEILECMTENKNVPSTENSQNASETVAENSVCQQLVYQASHSVNDHFWVRFYWLSGSLSLFLCCKEKAIEEFYICLSILRKLNDLDGFVPLPHCKRARWITVDRVLHQINLLKVVSISRKATEMTEKGMYKDCIDLLAPVLLSAKDVYPDLVSGALKGEGSKSVELSALDTLLSACEKAQPMEIELYLNSHRRKLQVLTAAAGMVDSPASQKALHKNSDLKMTTTSNLDCAETTHKHWYMVAEEVKELSQCASQVKNFIDQCDVYDGFGALVCVVGEMQSLLLTVMCNAVRMILSRKFSGLGTSIQTDQLECRCLVDSAIAFCKLQHLDPTVPIKAQVELIVAIHDLLAEYGLCCAGKDSEGEEGTFLKLAIKHLLALDVKLKSSFHSSSGRLETKQDEESFSLDDQEKSFIGEQKVLPALDNSTSEKEECGSRHKDDTEEIASKCLSTHETQDKDEEELEPGRETVDVRLLSSSEKNGNNDPADSGNLPIDMEREKVELGIDNALDQSFFCLYGLNLKCSQDSSSEDDLAIHKNTSRGDYQTKEQCANVFRYILPYAKVSSRAGIVKLRRVLRAIRKHFLQPPDDILAENCIQKFLDNPDLREEELCEVAGTDKSRDAIMNILFPNGRVPETCKTLYTLGCEPYLEVYSNLYYFIAQAEEISATDKFPGFVLKKEGEEFVEQNSNLFKYDLLYNPLRFESWQKLANIYDEEVDLLLNDGSKHINIVDWRRNAALPQRVEMGRRRSRRCLLMSLALARTPVQRSQIHELLALVYYDSLQNVVPFYDQRTVLPAKDATWMTFCRNSMKHFEKAFVLKPEWLHAFYLGKVCEKMGYSSDKAFSYYSKAISLNPSAVDPLYRMHASRLKLLYTHGKQNLVVLQTVASYSFNESTKQAILNLFCWTSKDIQQFSVDVKDSSICDDSLKAKKPIEPHQLDEAWHLLYNDCLSALEICVEGELKHFHKARYRLAQGLYRRCESGDLERAKDELSFCFRSSRSSFTINMWEIDSMVKKGRRRTPGLGGNRKVLEVSLPESSRKFITCIRKYILLYVDLLEKTKDLHTLDRAYLYLRTDKRFSLCLGDIVPITLGKYIKVLISSINNAENNVSDDISMSLDLLLERLFNILMDHVNQWVDICSLPEVKCPELLESSIYGYIHQYIHLLENDVRVDAIEGVNEKIRKRFKNPKLSNSNYAKICKHASVAWFQSILVKLAAITPLSDAKNLINQVPMNTATGSSENELFLFVDLQPDELCCSSLEGSTHGKGLEMKWYELLSKIQDVHVKQALDENMETATTLLKCAYNFYRESSCGTYPSGIKLYTVSSSRLVERQCQQGKDGVDVLDVSIPRKLLLWAYTLVHGHYSAILAAVKYCEENTKSRMKRGSTTSSALTHSIVPTTTTHTCGGREKNETDEYAEVGENSSTARGSNMVPASSETQKAFFAGPQLHHCSTTKAMENTEGGVKAENTTD